MMTSAQVVETSVNVTSNSPSQDYTHPEDHNLPNYDMTPGFKPFTVLCYLYMLFNSNLQLAYYYQRKGWKTCLICADTFRAGK